MRDRLAAAIELRETGRARQDQAMLEQALAMLLDLSRANPNDADISFQTAAVHDNLGRSAQAIPFYVHALESGLSGVDRASKLMQRERAYLGLGSTYRQVGQYQQAEETLRRGLQEFPDSRVLPVFLALALYNERQYTEAVQLLLTQLMETTGDETLQYFKRGLLVYAQHLDHPE